MSIVSNNLLMLFDSRCLFCNIEVKRVKEAKKYGYKYDTHFIYDHNGEKYGIATGEHMEENKYKHWLFNAAEKTYTAYTPISLHNVLPAGLYKLLSPAYGAGPQAQKIDLKEDQLCQFVNGPFSQIKDEVNKFWESSKSYKGLGITHKRGILFYGPAGTGKSSIINCLIKDVIYRGGIAFILNDYTSLENFQEYFPTVRQIDKDIPVLIVIEDIDSLQEQNCTEMVLEILEGVSSLGSGLLYVATTNKLNEIDDRIRCRPSRIDTLVEVGYPSKSQSLEYLNFLMSKIDNPSKDLVDLISNTKVELSLADLKEVVIGTHIYGRNPVNIINVLTHNKIEAEKDKKALEEAAK